MDWVSFFVFVPYLSVPIFAILWQYAKLPKINWKPISAGLLLSLTGAALNSLASMFATYVTIPAGTALTAFFSFFGLVSIATGWAIIGFYALIEALNLLEF